MKKYLFHSISCVILTSFALAQPKISGRLGIGYTTPDYNDFVKGSFPAMSFTEKMMINFTTTCQVYFNTRLGFSQWMAFTSDSYNNADFKRSFSYRTFYLETFYFPWKRVELNFMIGPLINTGTISLTTAQSTEVWGDLLSEFENENIDITHTDEMTTTFFGLTSAVGIRYYLKPLLGVEFQIGFIENSYDKKDWSFQDKTVTGPDIDVDEMPLYSVGLVYGL